MIEPENECFYITRGVSKMLKVQEIRELIKLVDNSSLDEFEYEFEDSKIKMKKNTVGAVSVVQTPSPVVPQIVQEPKIQGAAVAEAKEVKQESAPVPQVEKAANDEDLHKITSPMVGTILSFTITRCGCICESRFKSIKGFNRLYC